MTDSRYIPALHRVALLTAVATFPLIFMGGLVTSHGAGMSVPDWPNSYGYNMFTFPPSQWLGRQAGGIFYEHSHRLMGTVVGFASILLVLFAWGPARGGTARILLRRSALTFFALGLLAALAPLTYNNNQTLTGTLRHTAVGFFSVSLIAGSAALARSRDERRWMRWLAVGILAAVIFQGVLGGLRVVLVELDLAVVHACFAQAFFCLAALSVVVTSRWWVERPELVAGADRMAFRLAAALVVIVYLQLVVGALMRHNGAGLAIPDLPLAYGKVLPPVSDAGLDLANEARRWDAGLPGVSLAQIWLHFGHRIGALLVTVAAVALVARVVRRRRSELTRAAVILSALLLTQVTLGVLTVLWRKPADVASLHVAVGALVLVTAFVMGVRAARVNYLSSRSFVPSPLYAGERVRVRGSSSEISDLESQMPKPLTPALSPAYKGEGVSLSTN